MLCKVQWYHQVFQKWKTSIIHAINFIVYVVSNIYGKSHNSQILTFKTHPMLYSIPTDMLLSKHNMAIAWLATPVQSK